jgi:hypothetical protein
MRTDDSTLKYRFLLQVFFLLLRLLDAAIANPSDFTTAHAIQLIQRISENPENRVTLISYFTTMLMPIIERYKDSNFMSSIIYLRNCFQSWGKSSWRCGSINGCIHV